MRIIWALSILILGSQAHAQEAISPVERAAAYCIGPGVEIEDPWYPVRGLPQKHCEKACKANLKGCLAVVKARGKCGKAFLKGMGQVAAPICEGREGSKDECKHIKRDTKSSIAEWLRRSDAEILACVLHGFDCKDSCQ